LNELKRHEEALAAFDRAIQLDPQNAVAYNNKGYVLQLLGRTVEAEEAFRKAQALDS
jgi:Flp pilus assembly protein TadD